MKRILFVAFFFSAHLCGKSQSDSAFGHKNRIDSVKRNLEVATNDSIRIIDMQFLNFDYESENPDSSLKYGLKALELSRKSKQLRLEARSLNGLSGVLGQTGRFAEALEYLFEARKLAEQINWPFEIARSYRRTSKIYSYLNDFSKARDYDLQALILDQSIPKNRGSIVIDQMILADVYETLNKLDSAQYYANLALLNRDAYEPLIHLVFLTLGNIYYRTGKPDSALFYYRSALDHALFYSDLNYVSESANGIASVYHGTSKRDSTLRYAMMAFKFGQRVNYKKSVMLAAGLLADLYDSADARTALHYYRISNAAKDSLFGTDNIQIIQNLISREERSRKEAEEDRIAFRNRIRLYGLLSGLLLLLAITWLQYRNNRQKQKTNTQLEAQKGELQTAMHQLKTTQSQLIQAEKMASLGQLTAGIAHEIQNPLNFVNNFSEVNKELLAEMNDEIQKGNYDEVKDIARDLADNEVKISQHGKRAGAIVKSMLQHSQSGSGKMESTDLNALADEYMRLAFHDARAKDKSFNVEMRKEFDSSVTRVNVVPQNIGRVLLNLYNNALYTVNEKKQSATNGYEPMVSVTTRKTGSNVMIRVRDNGNGIPKHVLDKIFQPFFTTKPTGQGTGLGLSLSYDIVKAHGGEIQVDTKEGEYTEFLVQIPVM